MMNNEHDGRQEFRVDDIIPLRDVLLSKDEFEEKRMHISNKSRQSSQLQSMIGQDMFGNDIHDRLNPELSDTLNKLDAKLNYLIGATIMNDVMGGEMTERTVNLSCTGASFVPSGQYTKGVHIELTMMLATFPPTPIELLGEVMWVRRKQSGEPFVGIKFLFRSKEEDEGISHYIFKRSREMIRLKKQAADEKY